MARRWKRALAAAILVSHTDIDNFQQKRLGIYVTKLPNYLLVSLIDTLALQDLGMVEGPGVMMGNAADGVYGRWVLSRRDWACKCGARGLRSAFL